MIMSSPTTNLEDPSAFYAHPAYSPWPGPYAPRATSTFGWSFKPPPTGGFNVLSAPPPPPLSNPNRNNGGNNNGGGGGNPVSCPYISPQIPSAYGKLDMDLSGMSGTGGKLLKTPSLVSPGLSSAVVNYSQASMNGTGFTTCQYAGSTSLTL